MTPEQRRLILAAHTIDILVRKDGREYRLEGDFIKELLRGETDRCPRCGVDPRADDADRARPA